MDQSGGPRRGAVGAQLTVILEQNRLKAKKIYILTISPPNALISYSGSATEVTLKCFLLLQAG